MGKSEAMELLDAVQAGESVTVASVREALRATGDMPSEEAAYLVTRIRSRCIDDAGCWVWQGYMQKGVMPVVNIDDKIVPVRRALFQALHGPVKKGHEVTATCETHGCVSCVEQVTFAERRRRMAVKRNTGKRPNWKPAHSKLSVEKAREIRASEEPTAVLADRYGVSTATIGYVKAGKTWVEATPWTGLGAR